MKKEYVTPALETIKFDIFDVITLSNAMGGGTGTNKPRPRSENGTVAVTMTQDEEMIVNY